MSRSFAEPGLLRIFRLLIILSMLLQLVAIGISPFRTFNWVAIWRLIGPRLIILWYLWWPWWPWWQRRLGRFFLPIAFFIAFTGILLRKYVELKLADATGTVDLVLVVEMLYASFLILITGLLVGWQYGVRVSFTVVVAIIIVDTLLSLPFFDASSLFSPLLVPVLQARVGAIVVVAVVAWLITRLRAQEQALTKANHKVVRYAATIEQLAISQERNRLALELHDTLAHSLSGVTVQLEAVTALWEENPTAARTMLDKARKATRTGLTEARRALQALRAAPLDDLGLTLALTTLAEEIAERAALDLTLHLPHRVLESEPMVEQCLYRVAQESMTNVARHANATAMTVSLERQNGHLTLTITDNGQGFETAVTPQGHFGLQGLHERAKMSGGKLQVESTQGKGTAVKLRIAQGEQERKNDTSINL